MSGLKKATLQEIKADEQGSTVGPPIEVQFNPSSLKLQLTNTVEGGVSRTRQARQFLGKGSTVLSFDLIFDTADDAPDSTGKARSVRERTAAVEKFVVPKIEGNNKQAPPRVRFHWGDLEITGVISSLTIDYDLFSADGIPLRAKMGVSIQEQDPKYQFLKTGPGANPRGNVTDPGGTGGAAPGSSSDPLVNPLAAGTPPPLADRSAAAIADESAADFAVRMGLDPAAWRGIAAGLEGSTTALPAGVEIDFSTGVSASPGMGSAAGLETRAALSAEMAVGLAPGGGPPAAAGFALSAAGGVAAAIATVQSIRAATAASQARQAFGAPATAPAPRPAPLDQPRTPLRGSDRPPCLAAREPGLPAPPPPLADARAVSFGFGVPLRPRLGGATERRSGVVRGAIPLRPHENVTAVPATRDPTAPPWVDLPSDDRARVVADRRQRAVRPTCPCGCGGASHRVGGVA